MWSFDRRRFLQAAALVPLAGFAAGCGFEPLYGEGTAASRIKGRVDVAPLDGAPGFVLHQRLVDLLGEPQVATHYLAIDYDIDVESVALTQENIQTRFKVVGSADFELRPLSGEGPVLRDHVEALSGFSAPDSETGSAFATQMARQDAIRRVAATMADRVVLTLSIRAEEWVA